MRLPFGVMRLFSMIFPKKLSAICCLESNRRLKGRFLGEMLFKKWQKLLLKIHGASPLKLVAALMADETSCAVASTVLLEI